MCDAMRPAEDTSSRAAGGEGPSRLLLPRQSRGGVWAWCPLLSNSSLVRRRQRKAEATREGQRQADSQFVGVVPPGSSEDDDGAGVWWLLGRRVCRCRR